MEISLALLAFSAPLTAAMLKLKPRKRSEYSHQYVSTREYDTFKAEIGDRLTRIESSISSLHTLLKSRL